MFALLTIAAALVPAPPALTSRFPAVSDAALSRRNAIPLFGAGLALAAMPRSAKADSIGDIAARANAQAQLDRENAKPKAVREEGEGTFPVRFAVPSRT